MQSQKIDHIARNNTALHEQTEYKSKLSVGEENFMNGSDGDTYLSVSLASSITEGPENPSVRLHLKYRNIV